jgi:hypothetical protein
MPSSQAILLSPITQARLRHTNSLKLRHREVLAEHAINTPVPCRVKRQLEEMESELLKEQGAGRPAPCTALPASMNDCFVST